MNDNLESMNVRKGSGSLLRDVANPIMFALRFKRLSEAKLNNNPS